MPVLCVNSSITYSDIIAADAAEAGVDYGSPTVYQQIGSADQGGSLILSNSGYPSSFIYEASLGEETTGDINVGARCNANITTSVTDGVIRNIRTFVVNSTNASNHTNENLVTDGSGGDPYIYSRTLAGQDINCIVYNASDAWRTTATNDAHTTVNCTAVDCTGFGFLRPRCVNTVALNTGSSAYLQEGASSLNFWEDDGTGDNTIAEPTATDIFVDYAAGDYRISPTSSVGLAGAGAFIEAATGISITLDSGNYSKTVAEVQLLKSSSLSLDSGDYQASGTDVSLLVGRVLTIEGNQYAATGTDVGLLHNKIVSLESGTYQVSGIDVEIRYTPSSGNINLDSGEYHLQGAGVDLLVKRQIFLDSGNYIKDGTPLGLNRRYSIQLSSGVHTTTGSEVNLLKNLVINLGSGSYELVGSPITITLDGEVVEITSYTISYSSEGIDIVFKQEGIQIGYGTL